MKYVNRPSFLKHLKGSAPDHFSRVYLIAISDDFERGQVFDQLLRYLATPDRSVQRFSGGSLDMRAFHDHLQTTSLFGGEPIAVLDEVEKLSKKEQQELVVNLSYGYLLLGARSKTALAQPVEKEGVVLDILDEKPWDKEKRLLDEMGQKAANAGKSFAPGVAQMLLERLDKDAATIESEVEKLICYTGDRARIESSDVEVISSSSRSYSVWQKAEELIWEGKELAAFDEADFHALLPSLRSQLELGLKIASLLERNASREEWTEALPKVFPKTLEKRTSQAAHLGKAYFVRSLQLLFAVELESRTGSQNYLALLDLFRTKAHTYASR